MTEVPRTISNRLVIDALSLVNDRRNDLASREGERSWAEVRGSVLRIAVCAAPITLSAIAAPGAARADGCNLRRPERHRKYRLLALLGRLWRGLGEGGAGCVAAAGIGAALGGVAASQGQGSVDNFCSQLNTGVGDIDAIKSWLQAAGIGADLISDVSSLGAGAVVSVAQCACDLEQGVAS